MKVPEQYRVTKEVCEKYRLMEGMATTSADGNNGYFYIPRKQTMKGKYYWVIASDGMEWDHLSVSIPMENRSPTWEEMCWIKSLFFDDEEAVMQLHPPKSTWVNNHPFCLHIWRPQEEPIPLPDPMMVGLKDYKAENRT